MNVEHLDNANKALIRASDDHGWKATSLVEALGVMARSHSPIEPTALTALVDALDGHVAGLVEGINTAHGILSPARMEAMGRKAGP
jgi:hypothetical protein